jgi:hypothetical protein
MKDVKFALSDETIVKLTTHRLAPVVYVASL